MWSRSGSTGTARSVSGSAGVSPAFRRADFGVRSIARQIAHASSAAATAAARMPTLASSRSSPSKASSAMKRESVNPIPASAAAANANGSSTVGGKRPSRGCAATRVVSPTPRNLPTTSPRKTPSVSGEVTARERSSRSIATPAFARAKSGTMTKLDQGWTPYWMRSFRETVPRMLRRAARATAHAQPEHDAGDGRMDARLGRRHPDCDREQDQRRPAENAEPHDQPLHPEQKRRERERREREVARVRECDHEQDADVVRDRHREHEGPQPGREAAADEREQPEGKRGVGRHDDPPPRARVAPGGEREVDHYGKEHPADRREHGHARTAAVAELAHVELATHLEPEDEEEERHQPVVDPVPEIAVETDVSDSQRELRRPQLLVARGPRRVDPDERRDRGCEEEERAADLRLQERPQRRGDVPPPGRALRQRARG